MLYTEVDRLSTAWAALDEQNRDKVFKLAEHDEKVLKAVHEVSPSHQDPYRMRGVDDGRSCFL